MAARSKSPAIPPVPIGQAEQARNLALHTSPRDRMLAQKGDVKMLHHSVEDHEAHSGLKRSIGEILESHKMETLIVFLLVVDIVMVIVEGGIDLNIFCINGRLLEVAPADVIARAGAASGLLAVVPGAAHLATSTAMPAWMSASTAIPLGASLAGALATMPASVVGMATEQDESVYVETNPGSLLQKKFGPARRASGVGFVGPDGDVLLVSSSVDQSTEAEDAVVVDQSPGDHHTEGHEEHEGHEGHEGHAQTLVCEGRGGEVSHHIEHHCHQISVGILSLFLVELLLKVWIHPKEFMSRPLHVLDLFVVVVSLICDVIIVPMLEGYRARGQVILFTSILMVFRMWRVVRLLHGLYEVMHTEVEGTTDLASDLDAALAEIKRLQSTSSGREAPSLDQPGVYHIVYDGTSVTADYDVKSADVGELVHGQRVNVEEVQCVGTRVRGRISQPVAGWISLIKSETGQRWATREAESEA